jgi:hypothetical protein
MLTRQFGVRQGFSDVFHPAPHFLGCHAVVQQAEMPHDVPDRAFARRAESNTGVLGSSAVQHKKVRIAGKYDAALAKRERKMLLVRGRQETGIRGCLSHQCRDCADRARYRDRHVRQDETESPSPSARFSFASRGPGPEIALKWRTSSSSWRTSSRIAPRCSK